MTCPEHYKPVDPTAPEPWVVFDEMHMAFSFANALKYVLRHDKKGSPDQDLQKALNCLQRAARLETPFPLRKACYPNKEREKFRSMVKGQGDARFEELEHPLGSFMIAMEWAASGYFYGCQAVYEVQVLRALDALRCYIANRKDGALREHLESAHAALTAALEACPADGLSVPQKALEELEMAISLSIDVANRMKGEV